MDSDNNYYDTFIQVAEDCPVDRGEVPEAKGGKRTVPVIQYELIALHPYRYTQEDVLFESHAEHKGIPEGDRPAERERFFAKPQVCLRASALGKRYGWGIHHDAEGRVALYPVESEEYRRFTSDANVTQLKAMRSKRA